jgi:beta-glucosidase
MRILTFNLQHDKNQWEDRFPLVIEMLMRCNADVIAFQEIALKTRQDEQIQHALEERGLSYHSVIDAKKGKKSKEGIGTFTRIPCIEHERIDLFEGGRVAQRLTLDLDGRMVDILNVHLHHLPPLSEVIRYAQIQIVLKHIRQRLALDLPVILLGDLNTTPGSKTVALIDRELQNVFRLIQGSTLPVTFPTPSRVVNFPEMTIDYVFVSPKHIRAISAERTGDQPDFDHPSVYPSDHYGLLVEVQLNLV